MLQEDIERIVIHHVRSETAKPFARAEGVTTCKGPLDRVAFMVAGTCNHECYTVLDIARLILLHRPFGFLSGPLGLSELLPEAGLRA